MTADVIDALFQLSKYNLKVQICRLAFNLMSYRMAEQLFATYIANALALLIV